MTDGGISVPADASVTVMLSTIVAMFSLSNDMVSVSTPNGPSGISVHSHVVLWNMSFSILVMTHAVLDIVVISMMLMRIAVI